jgi:3-methyladenine DNA glycosylase AlkD
MTSDNVLTDLQALSNPEKAEFVARYFKTGPGDYGEGDVFLGLKVPETRLVAKKYKDLTLTEVEKLLQHKIHEARQCGLMIMESQYSKNPEAIFNLYLKNTAAVNNWDLVDGSAPYIVGAYLYQKDTSLLFKLAKSDNLWERRIAILSTFYFIKQGDYKDSIRIAEILLNDKHDLIHKAVGWMLREVGNKDLKTEEEFLDQHATTMPRTMLRYAIEKFTPERKRYYMDLKGLQ